MSPLSLSRFLLLYTWFPLAALLFVLLLIARYYEKFSSERTYYRLFSIPILLFGVATVRSASLDDAATDPVANLLLGFAGVVLGALCIHLYMRMLRGRPRLDRPK
ncbi:MAG: hypothetical protein DIU68_005775 [Chloroflexota bacterium]|nr:MAG: hypothetical protein DIU68_13460 [Chloroflexota bacterium]